MVNEKGEEVGIIYGWYNILTDMWYIGQTINPKDRFRGHIHCAINKKDNNKFHNALRKYGLDNFVYCVLEDNILRANLNMRETDWIEYYDSFYSGYNMTTGGDTNVIISEETRRRLSEARKERIFSIETKKKISESLKGRTFSIEWKKKLSESHKGKSSWNKGIPMNREAKKKLIESNKKKVNKYDLNGDFIKTYSSISEAIKQNIKCSGISAVCRGITKQAGGFIWKYA